jgi:AcrR family transcriptional regulator
MSTPSTKIRILQAAQELLLQGNNNTSMADIARATGISRQAVYIHYASREALLLALNDYLLQEFGLVEEQRRIAEAANGIAALQASAALQARAYPRVWAVMRALETAARGNDNAAQSVCQAQARNSHNSCAITIDLLVRDNLLRPGLDAETATDLLWSLTSIAIWEELVLRRCWSAQRYQEHIANLLIAALTSVAV